MKNLLFLLFLFLPGYTWGQEPSRSSYELLTQKSKEAREILSREKLSYHYGGLGKKKKVVGRDIALATYSPLRDAIDVVRLEIKVPLPKNTFVFLVATPGFSVERIRGRGPVRLAFNIWDSRGEKLILLDARHLMEPGSSRDVISYFPYTDDFFEFDFIKEGRDTFFMKIRSAREKLCALRVASRAFQGKLVCELFPDEFFATLGSIEQIDDDPITTACEFDRQCQEYIIETILVHVARNDGDTFCCNASRTNAHGFMQFMNTKRVPTYRYVVEWYPDAHLIRDFIEGTEDLENALEAAMCLLDHDIAEYFPHALKNVLFIHPEEVLPYAAVDYNGGAGRMMQLYSFLKGAPISLDNFRFPRKFPNETKGYLKKYFIVREYYRTHQ